MMDDDWEESDKDDDDDDADGPGSSTRATRQNLAQALFSNLIPSSGRSTPPASAPAAPPAPPAAPAAPSAPPAPAAPAVPAAPAAPKAPVIKPAEGPVDRGCSARPDPGRTCRHRAHLRLPQVSSAVAERSIDEAADAPPPPPPAPPAPPAPPMPDNFDSDFGASELAAANPNRQSVDWANSLANDQANTKAAAFVPDEPSVREEAEEDSGDEDEGPEDLDARKPANGPCSFGRRRGRGL
ncbi:hypothetical protein L1887_47829 [Cichorium endivia]|nr:hypothetical protein L1887_47829 [Cichorium endivia]